MRKEITIMYADDDEDDAFFFENVIRDIDISCSLSVFSSGIDLLESLARTSPNPDLIFMDINMPLKNGLECLKELRMKDDWKSIPVFMISTSDSGSYQQTALTLGASGYILKPNSYEALREELRETINQVC